jgi:hypothetical protein
MDGMKRSLHGLVVLAKGYLTVYCLYCSVCCAARPCSSAPSCSLALMGGSRCVASRCVASRCVASCSLALMDGKHRSLHRLVLAKGTSSLSVLKCVDVRSLTM